MLYFLLKDLIKFPLLGHILNTIYYFLIGVGVLLAFCLAYKRILTFNENKKSVRYFMALVVIVSIPAGYIGSRAANMFYYQPHLWSFNFLLTQFHEGGHHTFHGSIILPIISIIVLTMIMRLDFFKTIDSFFLYIPLGHAFGRMGCFLVGCCWGQDISMTLFGNDFIFKNPVPLYSIVLNIALFLLLKTYFNFIYSSRTLNNYSGSVAAFYLIIYGTTRFLLEWIRTENQIIFGLTQAQIVMIAFISTGCLIWLGIFLNYHMKGRVYVPKA